MRPNRRQLSRCSPPSGRSRIPSGNATRASSIIGCPFAATRHFRRFTISIRLELIGGGQDAEIRHLGDALTEDVAVQRIIDAPNPSLLHCIAKKLPIVAISRDFLAFEDSFAGAAGTTRCWVTLLPLSSCGSWVDYVYAFVSMETSGAK